MSKQLNKLKSKLRNDGLFLPIEKGDLLLKKSPDDINYDLEQDYKEGIISIPTINHTLKNTEKIYSYTKQDKYKKTSDLLKKLKFKLNNKKLDDSKPEDIIILIRKKISYD
jgi:intein/homing endonuclease